MAAWAEGAWADDAWADGSWEGMGEDDSPSPGVTTVMSRRRYMPGFVARMFKPQPREWNVHRRLRHEIEV